MRDKPSPPKIIYGKTDTGFGELEGWPENQIGQETEEQPDPLIYGYRKGGTVRGPGAVFRRKLAVMGYQRGGRVDDQGGPPAWAGQPDASGGRAAGGLPPGLQGTLPPGLANRASLPSGLANYQGGQPAGQGGGPPNGVPDQDNIPPTDWRNRFPGYSRGGPIQPLNPANKGKFTASAKAAGKGVQGFASQVLSAPKGQYSATQRRRANFARNAAHWKH